MTCTWLAHDLQKTCTWITTSCKWLVYDLHMTCLTYFVITMTKSWKAYNNNTIQQYNNTTIQQNQDSDTTSSSYATRRIKRVQSLVEFSKYYTANTSGLWLTSKSCQDYDWRSTTEGLRLKAYDWRPTTEGLRLKVYDWRSTTEGLRLKVYDWRRLNVYDCTSTTEPN